VVLEQSPADIEYVLVIAGCGNRGGVTPASLRVDTIRVVEP
jgi:hypothetical protein